MVIALDFIFAQVHNYQMEQITRSIFHSRSKETVQTKQALVSLSMSVPFFDLDYEMELLAERKEYKHPSFKELLEIFPEAVSIAKRETKRQMSDIEKSIAGLSDIRNVELERIYKEEKPRYHSACIDGLNEGLASVREKYEKHLRVLSWRFNKKIATNGFTPDDIARAKAFPMTSLIEVGKDGKALCVWHSERTPSMHYYKKTNNLHCFACNKSGDTIDVYRIQHGVSFNVAVKALI